MRIKIDINMKVGRVVKYFILSDIVLLTGWGLVEPVFAIFVIEKIPGASVITVGISAAIYWIIKSTLQLPIANYLDRTDGEKDDFYALITGLFIASISATLFVVVRETWQLYLVQAVHAVGFALYFSSWAAIFSRHLDKDRISFDWALNSTTVGIAAGISGLIGGIVAGGIGFTPLFVFCGILSAVAAMILLLVPDLVLPRSQSSVVVPPVIKEKPPSKIG